MRPILILPAFAALACGVLLVAQGPEKRPGTGRTNTHKERVRREIDEKMRLMREGKVVRTNVRVTVRLRNGSRLKGVVKNGRFIERVAGLEFVKSDLDAKGAGLRLWYYDQTNSYIFLPYESVASYKIGEMLTDAQVRAIAAELERLERAAKQRALARARSQTQKETTPPVPGGGEGPASAGKKPEALTEEQKALLAEFSPDEGWGPERLRELQARKIRIGVFPNEKEQRFIDNFEAWTAAYEKRKALEAAEAQEGKPGAGPVENPGPGGTPAPGGKPKPQSGGEPAGKTGELGETGKAGKAGSSLLGK